MVLKNVDAIITTCCILEYYSFLAMPKRNRYKVNGQQVITKYLKPLKNDKVPLQETTNENDQRKNLKCSDDDSDDPFLTTVFPKDMMVENKKFEKKNDTPLQDINSNTSITKRKVNYQSYQSIKDNIPVYFKLVTSEEEWLHQFTNRSCAACNVMVIIQNGDGAERIVKVSSLCNGLTKFPTKAKREETINATSKKGKQLSTDKEEEAISLLASMLLDQAGIKMIPCSTFGIENSSADAVIATVSSNHFIGVQVTRITFQQASGKATVHKSTDDILKMLGLGFIFVTCIFIQSQFIGAALWLPEHISIFLDIKPFSSFDISPFSNKTRGNSVAARIFYPFLFFLDKKRMHSSKQ